MIKSIIREHHFHPQQIDSLFLDDIDYHGLFYLYNDLKKANDELKESTK